MKTEEFGLDKKKRRENKKKGAAGTSMSIWTTPVERRLGRRLRWIVAGVAAAALLVSFTSAAGARTRNKKKKNDENEHTHTQKKTNWFLMAIKSITYLFFFNSDSFRVVTPVRGRDPPFWGRDPPRERSKTDK